MSAVTGRGQRSTAGKRLTFLTGQAAENDEAFWGHETWNDLDNDDDDNESFHSSDEDSHVKRDEFDSDFDESESDREDEDEAAGAAEERELDELERSNKRKHNHAAGYMEVSSAGRSLLVKQQPIAKRTKHVKGKRLIGEGLNAGIVLNLPLPGQAAAATTATTAAATAVVGRPPAAPLPPAPASVVVVRLPEPAAPDTAAAAVSVPKHPTARTKATGPTLAATRKRRSATMAYGPRDRAAKHATTDQQAHDASKVPSSSPSATKHSSKSNKNIFSQEDLLLEAVQLTEPDNLRWLLGRKRRQAEKDSKHGAASRETKDMVIEKFVSRRGYPNTISFPNMDHLPRLLQQSQSVASTTATGTHHPTGCVITGKVARYRDPKTGQGYHDGAAFRELRRRLEAKEPLDQRHQNTTKKTLAPQTNSDEASSQSAVIFDNNNEETLGATVKSPESSKAKTAAAARPKLSVASTSPSPSAHKITGEKNGHRAVMTQLNDGVDSNAPPTTALATPSAITSAILSTPTGAKIPSSRTSPTQQPIPSPTSTAFPATHSPLLGKVAVASAVSSPVTSAANIPDVASHGAGDGNRRSPRRRKPSTKVLENVQESQRQSVENGESSTPAMTESRAEDEIYSNNRPMPYPK